MSSDTRISKPLYLFFGTIIQFFQYVSQFLSRGLLGPTYNDIALSLFGFIGEKRSGRPGSTWTGHLFKRSQLHSLNDEHINKPQRRLTFPLSHNGMQQQRFPTRLRRPHLRLQLRRSHNQSNTKPSSRRGPNKHVHHHPRKRTLLQQLSGHRRPRPRHTLLLNRQQLNRPMSNQLHRQP